MEMISKRFICCHICIMLDYGSFGSGFLCHSIHESGPVSESGSIANNRSVTLSVWYFDAHIINGRRDVTDSARLEATAVIAQVIIFLKYELTSRPFCVHAKAFCSLGLGLANQQLIGDSSDLPHCPTPDSSGCNVKMTRDINKLI